MSKDYHLPQDNVRRNLERRLRVLEEKAAILGYNTPAEIITEIEDIQAKLAKLNTGSGSNTSLPRVTSHKPRWLWIITSAITVVTLLALGVWWGNRSVSPTANAPQTISNATSITEMTTAPAIVPPTVAHTITPTKGRIVFVSNRDDNLEIYTMNSDGNSLRRLTDNTAEDFYPTWSPDGKQIAFVSNRAGNRDIWVMNSDGNSLRRLTDNTAEDSLPTWSPDGKRIAFVSNRAGNRDIWVMKNDGSNMKQVTSQIKEIEYPAWSPDGTHVLFGAPDDAKHYEIYSINAGGGQPMPLTDDQADNTTPAWSPDGKQIAFVSNRAGNRDIWVMNSDGSKPLRLTTTPENDFAPTWSSDGTRIIFTRDRSPNSNCSEARYGCELFVMNTDGSDQTNLTDYTATKYDAMPDWLWLR